MLMKVAKANRLLCFIRRSCAGIDGSVALLRLYCSLLRSHFCYCSQFWAPQSVISNLFLVEKVQRATRFILKNSSNLSYKDRLIKLKLLPLNYWLEYLNLVFFFKCLHGHVYLTRSFNYYFSFVMSQTRQVCSGLNLKINNNRTSTFRDFYFNRIANLWNNIYLMMLGRLSLSTLLSVNLNLFISRDFSTFSMVTTFIPLK